MLVSPSGLQMSSPLQPMTSDRPAGSDSELGDMQKRFEQMLWAEMLSQSGLEDALTKNGGEAASPFARYVVEAIAKDIAETQPLGLSTVQTSPLSQSQAEDT
jgi:hypothetical protein